VDGAYIDSAGRAARPFNPLPLACSSQHDRGFNATICHQPLHRTTVIIFDAPRSSKTRPAVRRISRVVQQVVALTLQLFGQGIRLASLGSARPPVRSSAATKKPCSLFLRLGTPPPRLDGRQSSARIAVIGRGSADPCPDRGRPRSPGAGTTLLQQAPAEDLGDLGPLMVPSSISGPQFASCAGLRGQFGDRHLAGIEMARCRPVTQVGPPLASAPPHAGFRSIRPLARSSVSTRRVGLRALRASA